MMIEFDGVEMPEEVFHALNHVRTFFPEVIQVQYDKEGRWIYSDFDGVAPVFRCDVNISILEDAADSLDGFPQSFRLSERADPESIPVELSNPLANVVEVISCSASEQLVELYTRDNLPMPATLQSFAAEHPTRKAREWRAEVLLKLGVATPEEMALWAKDEAFSSEIYRRCVQVVTSRVQRPVKAEEPEEFIAQDRARVGGISMLRYTHMPSGKQIVKQPRSTPDEWISILREWLRQWEDDVVIYRCLPGPYRPTGGVLGTVRDRRDALSYRHVTGGSGA